MRVADPYSEVVLQEAGASVQAMPSSEIYTALQTGVLDGLLTSSQSYVSMRIFEQTNHATSVATLRSPPGSVLPAWPLL